ncbi:futalosine hydrolase [Streptomyces sp. TR06-5]|uniref:futalosine hydrolase n=1 Tax=unclassified Streptomyces TaxID=2593676 RepID=UPI00399FCB2A
MRVLLVTAVAAERDAAAGGGTAHPLPGGRFSVLRRSVDTPGGPVVTDALAAGVGPAAAAAGTATALTAAAAAAEPYGFVVSAGIGGGFPGVPVGAAVVATRIVAADLGADTADGFVSVAGLDLGRVEHRPPQDVVEGVARAAAAATGPVLTVSTATGTAERAAELIRRHPDAAAEAMEGFGVAEAASAHGVPVLELRTIANAVGPRDRAAWRIPEALQALGEAWHRTVPVLAGRKG